MNSVVSEIGHHEDADYLEFQSRLTARYRESEKAGVFNTDADDMWQAYLNSFESIEDRQYHNCHACRHFIQRFGGLVTISEDGSTAPAFWSADDAPEPYKAAVTALDKIARRAKVTGAFMSSDKIYGLPVTGEWRHLSVAPASVYRVGTLTASQAMAAKREDFGTVMRALLEFPPAALDQVVVLLQSDHLYRSEKLLGQAEWLRDLQIAWKAAKGQRRANVVWRAVASAPAGFCHPRTGMIGTLLDDIATGMDFAQVSKRFAEKMHPLRYQRPQAAPTAGAIAAAEKVMEKLGAAGSLRRRFARLDEIKAIWLPTPKREEERAGVFGHLKTKDAAPAALALPPITMTWEKFAREILPTAERIEVIAPSTGPYTALVTAADIDAPPILQWDTEEARNPVSWYFWHGGSSASQFGLRAGQYHNVSAITLKPSMWGEVAQSHHGEGIVLIIDGARETRMSGAAIFPECLKAELHGIRSVIEAYSRTAEIEGIGEPHAAGLGYSKGGPWGIRLRVFNGRSADYTIDRME